MRTLHYLALALLLALFATRVHAQELGIGVVCDTQQQVMDFYTDYKPDELQARLAKINTGTHNACAFLHIAFRDEQEVAKLEAVDGFFRILKVTVVGALVAQRWAQIEPPDTQYIAVFVKAQGVSLPFVLATWKPEYANLPPEVQQWYQEAKTTPEAQKRLGWALCCEHGDVVKAKFNYDRKTEEWSYQLLDSNEWKKVPPDIVHKGSSAPYGQATLFVYHGIETCFWPPSGGV